MEKKTLITPRKLQGFWELMPKQQKDFSLLLNKLEQVFKNNCFVQLDTPVLEYSDALLAKSGGETDKEVYRFSKGTTDMCLRYDLTVPLARFVAMHKAELNFPFRRYQIGKVYRGERPQKGRHREFYQCDADIIGEGSLSIYADAECVCLFENCFKALSLNVETALSNRKLLSGLLKELALDGKSEEILIVLDKIKKLPIDLIQNQLENLQIEREKIEKLLKFAQFSGNFDAFCKYFNDFCTDPLFLEGQNELKNLFEILNAKQCKNVHLDMSIIRGHNYYTGTVFEGFLKGQENLGAVGGGGRFENLCGYFSKDNMPGVGMSIGVTRLYDILSSQNYFSNENCGEIDCAIINFDSTTLEALKLETQLRADGLKAMCLMESQTFKAKMKEANRRGVNFVIIVGEDELKENCYTLKDMKTSNQQKLSVFEIEKILKSKQN